MTESIVTAAKLRPRSRVLLLRLLLIIGGVLAALLVAEVALRISGFSYFNPYIADQDVGYALRPNTEGWWTREKLTYIKINGAGFRDREHSVAKPSGTFRIAILGDSFAEAFQVPIEQTFWSVIEERVQGCSPAPRAKVEVLNFGVSGFSTARELVLLQKRVWQYSPDLIVLLVTPGNDIRDNSLKLTEYKNQPLPYFVFRNGTLVLDDSLLAARNKTLTFRLRTSRAGQAFNWLQNHVRILGLVYTVREAELSSRLSGAENFPADGISHEPGLDSEVYRKPATAEWEEAWQLTDALLVKVRDEVRTRGARFLVVTGSSGIQVTPDAPARQKFIDRLGVTSLFYPEERIRNLGQAEGFDVLNLSPALYEYANANSIFVHGAKETGGRGHWNQLGHRIAGELIATEICRLTP